MKWILKPSTKVSTTPSRGGELELGDVLPLEKESLALLAASPADYGKFLSLLAAQKGERA